MSTPARAVVVIGDAMVDEDVLASADRLVPDAPAPVLEELERRERPGGAALAAFLAARDPDLDITLLAPLADDAPGRRLRKLLAERVRFVALETADPTAVKTRLRCGPHTVARLDRGAGPTQVNAVPAAAREALAAADAVLVSDYGRGVTRSAAVRMLLHGRVAQVPVVWDPHPSGAEPVPGVALATPNLREAGCAADAPVAVIRNRADELSQRWHVRGLVVTLGARGALLSVGTGSPLMFPAPAASGDACGAGDCFAAGAVTAMARGALPSEAVGLAVAAASRFIAGGGVARLDEPATAPGDGRASVESVVAVTRASGGRVVATGGCFDLLHAGHLATLTAARALGDCLIVCVNSDESVRRSKGEGRPLQPVADRVRMLAALRPVDAVTVFDDDTPERVLRDLRPDVWVKGGDYTAGTLPETPLLRSWGGEVVTVPYLAGRSTTELVDLARR
jgi:D-beta-D-heptose 7-phosphate kinase / D-beta-D-heptose 1-phosphate adenosyltransferase